MPTRPRTILPLLAVVAPGLSRRVWRSARVLAAGALRTPGKRTVAAALRVAGLSPIRRFERCHRVLNRACWSGLAVSRSLLRLLVVAFVPDGPIVVGVDETIERRRGATIDAKGIYRDAVRSSRSHFVKASGWRWGCLMLLVPIRWAGRVWALPFLAALAPSERYDEERGRRHKPCPSGRANGSRSRVAGSTYAALEFLTACQSWANPVTVVTRLRLDTALYEPAPPRKAGQVGRPRRKGKRLPTLAAVAADAKTAWARVTIADWYGQGERTVEVASAVAVWYQSGMPPVPLRCVRIRDPQGASAPQALLCTDQDAAPEQVLAWAVLPTRCATSLSTWAARLTRNALPSGVTTNHVTLFGIPARLATLLDLPSTAS